ncbi:MAG TPA: SIS domain-containing protein [Candidatus Jeotgalibaca pullicola]|nr:SIS domain-containing protein [Candidatus Jeotgalibaca pullicola]
MDFTEKYYQSVLGCLEKIDSQKETIKQAANLMSDAQKNGHTLYAIGTGHSHMIAEEVYARAGGFAKIYPIIEVEMTLITDPMKSTYIERESSYANVIESLYPVKENDVLIAVSNSGRNPFIIEYVQRMRSKGVKIIVITSMTHTSQVDSRHESGLKLFELGDFVLDNTAPYNDASIEITEDKVMGPVSTITGTFIIQNLVGEMVTNLVSDGVDAPVFKSSNADHADEYNKQLFNKYIYKR